MNKKEIITLLIARALQILISLFTIRLMTSFLSNEQMGEYYIFLAIYMLASMGIINPIGQYVNRNTYLWWREGILTQYISRYISFVLCFSFVYVLLYGWGGGVFKGINTPLWMFFCYLYIVCLSLNQFLLHTLNILNFKIVFSIMTLMTSVLSLSVAYLSIEYSIVKQTVNIYSWIAGIIIGNFISLCICVVYLRYKNTSKESISKSINVSIKDVFNFCCPIMITTLFIWFQSSGYRFAVEQMFGLKFLGVLAVCFAVSGQIMSVIESLVTQIFQPTLFKHMDNVNNRKQHIDFYINENIAIYASVLFFCTFFMHEIFLILVDSKYLTYFYIGVIALWSEFFRISTNTFSLVFFCEKRMKVGIFPYLIGSLSLAFLIALFKLLNVNLGILIAFAIGAAQLVSFIVCLITVKKIGYFRINFIFLMKRLIIVLPSVLIAHWIPKFEMLNTIHFIIIFGVGLFYLISFVTSFVFVKQPGNVYGS
ncbi:lipopolysaccharide biosynthesis protein [Escherichia albertii]|uniref:Putative O-antigen transporter n=1 Tax=Escherichia albertii TaxID=208962 RepID=A0A5A4U769_ESCAL|nr:oligosaccharide flippase family protein [Escherichia albertii]MCZ9102300.1 oligosaccharide flippase family protein [Escherichia albertii]WDC08271.1 oligosaccharide flippase family protein [Escherichia albertii]BBM62238.1 O-antigen flippase [Escherichia albertii]